MAERTRTARLALAAFALPILIVAAVKLIPALLEDTTATSSTPVRRELAADTVIPFSAGQRACLDAVAFDTDSDLAQLLVRRVHAPGARLVVTASAPGWRSGGSVTLPAGGVRGWRPEEAIALTAPDRSRVGQLCVRNAGPGAVDLIASADPRALTRTAAVYDPPLAYGDAPARSALVLTLLDAEHRSLAARAPDLTERAAALSPFGPWLFWALIPLVGLGLPLLVGAALWRSLREPDPAPPRDAA